MCQQYPNAYHSEQRYGLLLIPSRFVVILDGFLFFSWLQFVTDSFFYLCTNQTWHASDSSALCRVFSTSREVCGNPCGWFIFIYFHFCKFYAIYIENEVYFCPIK